MRKYTFRLLIVALVGALAGCADLSPIPDATASLVPSTSMPAPAPTAIPVDPQAVVETLDLTVFDQLQAGTTTLTEVLALLGRPSTGSADRTDAYASLTVGYRDQTGHELRIDLDGPIPTVQYVQLDTSVTRRELEQQFGPPAIIAQSSPGEHDTLPREYAITSFEYPHLGLVAITVPGSPVDETAPIAHIYQSAPQTLDKRLDELHHIGKQNLILKPVDGPLHPAMTLELFDQLQPGTSTITDVTTLLGPPYATGPDGSGDMASQGIVLYYRDQTGHGLFLAVDDGQPVVVDMTLEMSITWAELEQHYGTPELIYQVTAAARDQDPWQLLGVQGRTVFVYPAQLLQAYSVATELVPSVPVGYLLKDVVWLGSCDLLLDNFQASADAGELVRLTP